MRVVQRFRVVLWPTDEFHNTICPSGTFFSTCWQLNCSFHMPWGHWSAPFGLSVLLNSMKDWSSYCHDSDLPPGTTESVPRKDWGLSYIWKCPRKDCGLSYIPPLQLLPLALVSQQLCLQARCLSVLWGYLHLSLQCQICDFTHQSFLSWSVIWAVITPLCSSGGLNEGEEGQTVFQQAGT